MRILFTGGTGKAGRHVVPYLVERGHTVLNADLEPLDHPGVNNIKIDISDPGQVFSTMQAYANFDELERGEGMPAFDAVVHFAAMARILIVPDNETYRINVMSTYNVIDAALRMGVKKVIFASSETVYGICFWDGPKAPAYLPIDEEHPTVPQDTYAMSKVVNEATARSFHARTGADIYGLRISEVMEPYEYPEKFPGFAEDPSVRLRNNFCYIDVRDLATMVERCLEVDGLGYEVFNVGSPDLSVPVTTSELIAEYYPGVEVKREMKPDEAFYCSDKAKKVLGWRPVHSWRDEI
ncbi:MAG: NAD(P)-dependent oxidoreductase [Pseudomonadota bacterium]